MTQVMELDAKRTETIHALPAFLPDGNHFVFAVGTTEREKGGIFVGRIDRPPPFTDSLWSGGTLLVRLGTRSSCVRPLPESVVLSRLKTARL